MERPLNPAIESTIEPATESRALDLLKVVSVIGGFVVALVLTIAVGIGHATEPEPLKAHTVEEAIVLCVDTFEATPEMNACIDAAMNTVWK